MTDVMTTETADAQRAGEQAAAAAPPIVDRPCRHYGPDGLGWPEHPELEGFMRATYEAHVASSCARRTFEPSVPKADLAEVVKGKYLRRDAAALAIRMLDDAHGALRQAQAAGDQEALATRSFGISSAYRSALHQYKLWNDRFPCYMNETAGQRASLPGGPVGDGAARWLAQWIGGWLAAPGFSNHNDGRAIDFFCRLTSGRVLTANRADIPRWHTSWLHKWLCANAARCDFHPYSKEPWHWEHRPGSRPATLVRPAPETETEAEAGQLVAWGPGAAAYWRNQLRFGLVGNTVEPLIDGPAAFRAIQQAIESAQDNTHFIYLLGWWTDPWVNLTGPGTCLLDLFARAGERGVQIRVLVWAAKHYPDQANLHELAAAAINRLPNCHAERDDSGSVFKSHHQKLLVVQGREGLLALCGGVDVNADRVNDLPPPPGSYRADRPPVGWADSSGSGSGGSGNPLHDVHARLSGPTALPLLRVFLRRWWARSGSRDIDRRSPLRGSFSQPVPAPTGSQFVRVGETFSGVLHRPEGNVSSRQVTVQDIWLRSILGARRFIYMEEQYLVSDCAAAAIGAVLPRLEHVTILIAPSELVDMPWVWERRKAFIHGITARNPHAAKLHVYTRAAGQQQPCIRAGAPHLYVHAKMAVIDDELMLIGSANCNNRGWETDSELVTASFEDATGPGTVAGGLRAALWSYHLGVPASAVADPVSSRQLWDTAGTRRVCRYDPDGGHDHFWDWRPESAADPSDRRPGDPCRTLLPRVGGG
jgi:phosphatidylserine/phosphatidylglycerophosphate/cardiolipin synthase-like enzyme